MNGGTGPMDLDAIVFESVDQQQPKAIAHASAAQTSTSGSQSAAASGSAGRLSATPNAVVGNGASSGTSDPGSNADDSPPAVNAQPAAVPAGVTASPNAATASTANTGISTADVQPSAIPNASLPNTSQAERSDVPESSNSSKSHHGLPKGAIVGIAIGCVVVFLLIAAFIFILYRRRRRNDPDTEFGYFFRGQGSMSEKRDQYLGRSDSRSTQFSSDSGETLRGYGEPFREKDVTELPTPLPPQPAYMGNSAYMTNTAQHSGAGMDDASDITDMYSRTEPGTPMRPPRPPELRLRTVVVVMGRRNGPPSPRANRHRIVECEFGAGASLLPFRIAFDIAVCYRLAFPQVYE
ncbi:hypothetical protein NUW54_g13635 [Trametes sanguinea]|uniref:Uncharacterized protein n=1 Tax=Trametes sanguinea TaxID=158606 RepID=A0ACC1MK21_9APHY|nr:hypothetical protein NUW54_g13635 [Trametes sanguinea]